MFFFISLIRLYDNPRHVVWLWLFYYILASFVCDTSFAFFAIPFHTNVDQLGADTYRQYTPLPYNLTTAYFLALTLFLRNYYTLLNFPPSSHCHHFSRSFHHTRIVAPICTGPPKKHRHRKCSPLYALPHPDFDFRSGCTYFFPAARAVSWSVESFFKKKIEIC